MLQANKKKLRQRTMSALPDYISKPKRSRPGWGDALSMVGGFLMDADGTMGSGNMQGAMTRTQQRLRLQDQEKQAELDRKRRMAILDGMNLTPRQRAIMELGGDDRGFVYGMERDAIGDKRTERAYNDSRTDRAEDVAHRGAVHDHTVSSSDRTHAFRTSEAERDQSNKDRTFALNSRVASAKIASDEAENTGPNADDEGKLRREYLGQAKPFQEVQRAFSRVKVTNTDTAAGQMGLIFQIMKMYDPGSTVREGEFANAQNTTGVPGAVINAYNKARSGQFLSEQQVSDFLNEADALYAAAASDYGQQFDQYRTTAEGYGYDLDRTIPDLRLSFDDPADLGTGPAVGDVVDGFVYLGGDKNLESSWGIPGETQSSEQMFPNTRRK